MRIVQHVGGSLIGKAKGATIEVNRLASNGSSLRALVPKSGFSIPVADCPLCAVSNMSEMKGAAK